MDLAKPHEQRTIHERESASIDSAQRRGRIAVNTLWMKLIASAFDLSGFRLPIRRRDSSAGVPPSAGLEIVTTKGTKSTMASRARNDVPAVNAGLLPLSFLP